jgi:hypothetical protein
MLVETASSLMSGRLQGLGEFHLYVTEILAGGQVGMLDYCPV